MGFGWGDVWDAAKRAGTAAATGGLSEAGGVRTLNDAYRSGVGQDFLDSLDRTKSGAAAQFQNVDEGGNIANESRDASRFADRGQRGYDQTGRRMNELADVFRRQMSGQDSVSAEQLRQGLAQQQAAQLSMAASARPGNQAMAARQAMLGMGRAGSAAAGQQAIAGLQERNLAAQQLGGLLGTQRQQDLSAALGARGQALTGYGDIEAARTARYGAALGVPTPMERVVGAAGNAAEAYLRSSDRRAKENIAPGGPAARGLLEGLGRAYSRPATRVPLHAAAGAPGYAATQRTGMERLGAVLGATQGIGAQRTPAAAASPFARLGAVLSDLRRKRDVADGGAPARTMLDRLEPATFRYRDPERHGSGRQPRHHGSGPRCEPDGAPGSGAHPRRHARHRHHPAHADAGRRLGRHERATPAAGAWPAMTTVADQVVALVERNADALGLPLVLVVVDRNASALVMRYRRGEDDRVAPDALCERLEADAFSYPFTVTAIGPTGESRTLTVLRPGVVVN